MDFIFHKILILERKTWKLIAESYIIRIAATDRHIGLCNDESGGVKLLPERSTSATFQLVVVFSCMFTPTALLFSLTIVFSLLIRRSLQPFFH